MAHSLSLHHPYPSPFPSHNTQQTSSFYLPPPKFTQYPQNHSPIKVKRHKFRVQCSIPNQKSSPQFHRGIFTNTWWANLRAALGQRLNLEGIITSLMVITTSRDRHMLLPHVSVPNIRHVNWVELHQRGFRSVLFDKDNTITLPYELTLWDPLKPSLDQCRSVFGDRNVAVFSNSAGLDEFDWDESKARAVEGAVGMRVIRHRVKKPGGSALEIENQLGCRSKEIIIVGDRRFTDMVYGNKNGLFTILVRPISYEGEPFVVRVVRWMEGLLVGIWCRMGLRAKGHCLLSPDEAHLVCLKDPI